MQITEHTRPFRACYLGVPVLMALFYGVADTGEKVQGIVAQYPDGVNRVLSVAPKRQIN